MTEVAANLVYMVCVSPGDLIATSSLVNSSGFGFEPGSRKASEGRAVLGDLRSSFYAHCIQGVVFEEMVAT
jgi:hypothetical protein